MNAIDVLCRCRDAETEIRALNSRIMQRRDAIERITSIANVNGGGHGGGDDRMTEFIAAITELEARIEKRTREYGAEMIVAVELFDLLGDELERAVLDGCYIRRETIVGCAMRLGYSEGYVRRVKGAAEKHVNEIGDVDGMFPEWYKGK